MLPNFADIKCIGIVNATPDSFFDGNQDPLATAQKQIAEGADMLDIGGESSRPGAIPIIDEEELFRVVPIITALQNTIPLSIDTRKVRVAKKALELGVTMVNDITGLSDRSMRSLVADAKCEVCIMHMQGTPETMQKDPYYPEGIIPHLLYWFEERLNTLAQAGISLSKVIIDPGIGFGKTVEDNLKILTHIPAFKQFGCRVLIGLSRKSFMAKILNKKAPDLLPATLAMNTMALLAGADIIRVHDVAEHRDMIKLLSEIPKNEFSLLDYAFC